jgi:hypothetical protein
MNQKMNPNLHNEGEPPNPDDLSSLMIRDLLAELTRLEDRLNSRRAAAGYHANTEIARLERQMSAVRAELRQHRAAAVEHNAAPLSNANEAGHLEDSISVESAVEVDADEEYPHQQQTGRPE